MGRLIATAGAKFYIGNLPKVNNGPDFILSDFAGIPWVEIGGTTDMASLGDTSEVISSNQIGIARTRKAKGVRNAGQMQIVADIDYTDAGQLLLIAAEKSPDSYPFKIVLPKGSPKASTATISIASPGVVTWNGHGLAANDPVKLSTTGALPTGLAAGTTYYVKTVLDANTFTLSASAGGAVINTTGSQSGVHTIETLPSGPERYFTAFVMGAPEGMSEANSALKVNATLEIDSNIVRNP